MQRIPAFYSVASAILVLFFVLQPTPADTAGLTLFDSESAFLEAAPIVSTERFDDLPERDYFTPTILLDEVVYSIGPTDFPCLNSDGLATSCWRTLYGGPNRFLIDGVLQESPSSWPAASDPYLLLGNHSIRLGDTISFRDNLSVEAFGFYFSTPDLSDSADEPPYPETFTGWEMFVLDTVGETHRINVTPELASDGTSARYFGFISEATIKEIRVMDKFGDILGVNWAYDNVSRSAVVVPLPPPLLLFVSVLVPLGWLGRYVRA